MCIIHRIYHACIRLLKQLVAVTGSRHNHHCALLSYAHNIDKTSLTECIFDKKKVNVHKKNTLSRDCRQSLNDSLYFSSKQVVLHSTYE